MARLIWYNIKISLDWNVAAAFALMLLAPFIFSFDLLEYKEVAKVSELYFSITGIILFAYIGNIENQEHTNELVNVRALPHVLVLLIRILLVTLFILLMLTSILSFAKLRDSVFPLWEMTAGAFISAAFLGSIAYTLTNLTNQVSSGYIMAFAYYLMEYTTKGKYTGSFYLFSLMKQDFAPKYYLLAAIVGIFAINLIYTHKFKSKLNQISE
jgi:hypothetical protein